MVVLLSIALVLSAYLNNRPSAHDYTAVGCKIALTGRLPATDVHRGTALYNCVRRSYAGELITHYGGRHIADQYRSDAGTGNRPAHVWHRPVKQGAGVEVGLSCCGRHGVLF